MRRIRALLWLCGLLLGCSAQGKLDRAVRWEDRGLYPRALEVYEGFAGGRPGHPRTPEALYRAARIYQKRLQRYEEARDLFERVARGYPQTPWAKFSREALMDCPDYFPLEPGGRWIYGDSQSGGNNMRAEYAVEAATSAAGVRMIQKIYAGKRFFQTLERRYLKSEGELREFLSPEDYTVILKYPFIKGHSWSSLRGGTRLAYSIEEDRAAVRVRAGEFLHCVKVREQPEGASPSWKYDYYAPGVGRILTTVAGKGFENPNTELISYQTQEGRP